MSCPVWLLVLAQRRQSCMALVSRQALLGWFFALGLAPQAVQAQAIQAAEIAQTVPPDCAQVATVPWQGVAPGVWVWLPERVAEISPANQGRVLPISAVVDTGLALVVDPGPSHQLGLQVRQSLACQLGAQVRWVVNTHAHAESVLGNSAFLDLQAQGLLDIAASTGTREAMKKRCEQCLQSLTTLVGLDAMAGSRIVLPNRILHEGDTLQVGRIRLQVMLAENAHTESDLFLWAPGQRVLWAGGLLYEGRIPELAQGSLNGWLNTLPRLAALRPAVVVGVALSVAPDSLAALQDLAAPADSLAVQPGSSAAPPILKATEGYLQALRQRVLQAMDAGLDGSELQSLELPQYAGWAGYRQRHGFNLQRAWRELEPGWMAGARPAGPASASVPDIGR